MLSGSGTREHPLSPHRPLLRARTNLQEEIVGPLEENLTLENMYRRMRVISEQVGLTQRERNRLINELTKQFAFVFNAHDYSRDYETLKKEVKFLATLTRYSFLHMAKRLIIIRDNKLYRKDGYATFKDFIEEEIPLSRSTVYNYIDIVTFFGVQLVGQTADFEYSKLLPVLPLLKANNDRIPKEEIKEKFLQGVETKTKSELTREAQKYKKLYGLVQTRSIGLSAVFRYVLKNVPKNPNTHEKEIVWKMIEYLTNLTNQ
jgi:hypothetical protein